MQTIQLQVEDNKLHTFMTVIENLKDGIVKNIKIESSELDEDTKAYMQTEQFQNDKEYFQNTLADIESGKTECLTHDEVWEQIENHTKAS